MAAALGGQLLFNVSQPAVSSSGRESGSGKLEVQAFKFMKQLGLKKPAFLPDFGKDKRVALLDRFYTNADEATYNELLADDFELVSVGKKTETYNKQQWKDLLLKYTLPAIPDFNFTHATDGSKDDEGYCIVTVQATGHHTGKPFELPGLPPIPASNKRFALAEEKIKVKVEDGQIKQMVILPVKNAGPLALYKALGGKVPSSNAA
ncbi:hypothetical protein WJX72_000391 [[Myrmecia] bisecta]|uniref:Uncharacterized protein n=1 Tax=[Myrmecia] bisecta TaxID=41462 RepID=A0AAW1Q4C1_9CHLO